jgi:hypothetical protein
MKMKPLRRIFGLYVYCADALSPHLYRLSRLYIFEMTFFQTGLSEFRDGRGTLSTVEEEKSQRIALA